MVFCKVTPEQDFVSEEKIGTTVFRQKETETLPDYKQGFIRASYETDNLYICTGFRWDRVDFLHISSHGALLDLWPNRC